jgi:uncharacterized RDD family membrane protein YckC
MAYAGFWKRATAALIDGILLIVCCYIVLSTAAATQSPEYYAIARLICYFVIPWIYFAGMESSFRQATAGKMIVGIVVTDLEGNKISFKQASLRYWAKLISFTILYIGFLMAGFTKKKQALHDMITNSLVIVRTEHSIPRLPGV